MKKALSLLLALVLCLSLCACGQKKVVSATLDAQNQLTLTYENGDVENFGVIEMSLPEISEAYFDESGNLTVKYQNDAVDVVTDIDTTVTVKSVVAGETGEAVVEFTNGESKNVGYSIVASGNASDTIEWVLYSNNTMVFSGSGAMDEYYDDVWYQRTNVLIPWYDIAEQVQKVVIEEGITTICNFAFIDFINCRTIDIADSVTKIGHCAFEHCYALENLLIKETVTELGAMVFHSNFQNVLYEGTKDEFRKLADTSVTGEYDWSYNYTGNILYFGNGWEYRGSEIVVDGYDPFEEETDGDWAAIQKLVGYTISDFQRCIGFWADSMERTDASAVYHYGDFTVTTELVAAGAQYIEVVTSVTAD